MLEFHDHYKTLGVTPPVTTSELHKAYRIAARRFHPDVNKSPGAALIFRDINFAHEVLSDPQKKNAYDKVWQDHAALPPALQIGALLSRRYLRPIDESQLLYALVKVQPLVAMSMATDAPLNICLVVDRSTSMKGARLQHVKNAVHRIIEECGPEDIISVVTFSDHAELLLPAQRRLDAQRMRALISTMTADGATAIFAGLQLAMQEVKKNLHSRYVNHIILITDGRTYGDEELALQLAEEAHQQGVSISGMGIGEDWNDRFLDDLAAKTGGTSAYVSTAAAVSYFLHERVRSLATAFAERAQVTVGPATDVELVSVIRTTPDPMALPKDVQPIALGTMDGNQGLSLMLQFELDTSGQELGEFFVGRVVFDGDILGANRQSEKAIVDLSVEIVDEPVDEEPPPELLDALSQVALYRLHDKAREALDEGDINEATRKLEYLATRLFESGAEELGQAALSEARQISQTQQLSDEGAKQLKYGTRNLASVFGDKDG